MSWSQSQATSQNFHEFAQNVFLHIFCDFRWDFALVLDKNFKTEVLTVQINILLEYLCAALLANGGYNQLIESLFPLKPTLFP